MNEELNLIKILKNVPIGTKLYSPVFGEISFYGIDEMNEQIYCNINFTFQNWNNTAIFDKFGRLELLPAKFEEFRSVTKEIMLFPSENNRNWFTFKVPEKHKIFEPFEKVLVVGASHEVKIWSPNFYSRYDNELNRHVLISGSLLRDNEIMHYKGNESLLNKPVE